MAQEDKIISIVIPTYNRDKLLEQTLPSYLKQWHLKEVIVVDDCSSDQTGLFVKRLMSGSDLLKYIKHPHRKGASAARNTGIASASGEYILFGEDDIIFTEDYSFQLLKCMTSTGASLISGRIIYMQNDESQKEAIERADKYTGPLLNKRLLYLYAWKKLPQDQQMPFTQACILAKRMIFQQCKFDENYGGNGWNDETDFQLEAAKLGYKIYLCPHTACFHLPRRIDDKGGQWSMNIFAFTWWSMKNNHYFLKKHYNYLKKSLGLRYTKNQLMSFAFLDRLTFTVNQLLYKRGLK